MWWHQRVCHKQGISYQLQLDDHEQTKTVHRAHVLGLNDNVLNSHQCQIYYIMGTASLTTSGTTGGEKRLPDYSF